MPTPTEYFGYSVTNIGPLTTRFTPAPACATTRPNVYIETQLADTRGLYGYPSCSAPIYDGCLPSGKVLDDLYRDLAAHPRNGNLVYHSPGFSCPSGWRKAGAVVGGDKRATRPPRVFTGINTSPTTPNGNPEPLPKLQAYAGILDPGETLVWCCPKYGCPVKEVPKLSNNAPLRAKRLIVMKCRGFKANDDAMCTSDMGPLSSYPYSQRCEIYLPSQDLMTVTSYRGTMLSNPLIIVTSAVSGISSSTYTIAPSETSGLMVVSAIPVVALMHKPSDRTGMQSPTTPVMDDEDSSVGAWRPSLVGALLGAVLTIWTLVGNL